MRILPFRTGFCDWKYEALPLLFLESEVDDDVSLEHTKCYEYVIFKGFATTWH